MRHCKLTCGKGSRDSGNSALIYPDLYAVPVISTNWKKSFQKWLDTCRYSVNTIPEADINVMEGEITSFTKTLLQIITISWVSTALRVFGITVLDFNASLYLSDIFWGYVHFHFSKLWTWIQIASAIEGIPEGLLV